MIEELLYFALGFSVAALLAIAALPAFWERARRLTQRRLEALLPTAPEQITAARDQLRAEFAVERRRLEQRLDEVLAARHGELVEIGRRTTAIRGLEGEIAAQDQAIEALERSLQEQTLETGRVEGLLVALRAEHETLSAKHGALSIERDELFGELEEIHHRLAEGRAENLSLDTLIEGLRARGRDLETMLATSRNELNARTRALRTTETEFRAASAELAALRAQLSEAEALSGRREAARAQLAEESRHLAEAMTAADKRLAAFDAGETARVAELEAARRRIGELESELQRQRADTQQTVSDLAQSLERLKAEKWLVEGALQTAREEREKLQHGGGRGEARTLPSSAVVLRMPSPDERAAS